MVVRYALVTMLDLAPSLVSDLDLSDAARAWAGSGAMELTGRRQGLPLLGPASAAPVMTALARRLLDLSSQMGRAVDINGAALLGERAAIAGHSRQGEVSCGGTCHLLRAADGWIAVSLAREDDRLAVPAWLEAPVEGADLSLVADLVRGCGTASLVERATWLGLPVAALGEERSTTLHAHALADFWGDPRPPVAAGSPRTRSRSRDPVTDLRDITVVDLSSLWAGPLCGQLLAAAGADVVKVESVTRPDGARRGPRRFFELMNDRKRGVVLDFTSPPGRDQLHDLIDSADVVIEASRPRALEQLGIDAWSARAKVWLSITGHGREQPMRVAFGDDAAVAGGCVAYDETGPVFAGDAIADPATGLLAAVAVLDRLASPGRWLLDVALSRTAALLASQPPPDESWDGPVAAPRSRN